MAKYFYMDDEDRSYVNREYIETYDFTPDGKGILCVETGDTVCPICHDFVLFEEQDLPVEVEVDSPGKVTLCIDDDSAGGASIHITVSKTKRFKTSFNYGENIRRVDANRIVVDVVRTDGLPIKRDVLFILEGGAYRSDDYTVYHANGTLVNELDTFRKCPKGLACYSTYYTLCNRYII